MNYFPEPISTGKYTGELVEYLAGQGHQVRVITAPPYYPQWKVSPEYKGRLYCREDLRGVRVFRCPLWVPRQPNGLKRLVHLAFFALSSFPVVLFQAFWRPHWVFCVAPTILNAPGALLAARLCGAKSRLHVQDFELDAALELGLVSKVPLFSRLAGFFEKRWLSRFDQVSTISKRMVDKLKEKGVDPGKIFLLPNWVDTGSIYPLPGVNPLRAELGIPAAAHVVLYSGNLGFKQGLEVLVEAARLLQTSENVLFVICGDGAARAEIVDHSKGLSNVMFLPVQPLERLNLLLNLADVHVLPQKADVADLVMPSKLGGMLASGKAVIATAFPGTGVAEVVGSVGVLVDPGDADALAAAILELVNSPEKRVAFGKKGREFALRNLSSETILDALSDQLMIL